MVVDLAVVRAVCDLPATHGPGFDGEGVFGPVDHVQIVDVLLGDVVAADPCEVVPVAELILHFGEGAAVDFLQIRPFLLPRPAAVPVTTRRDDVPDRAVVEAFDGFLVAEVMVALQAHAHLEVLPFGFLRGGQDFANPRGVGRDGFLHEHVFPLGDSFLELHRPESRRRREDRHIALGERFFVAIKPHELSFRRNVHAVCVGFLQVVEGAREPVLVHVGHCHEFQGPLVVGVERLIGRA